MPLFHIHGLVAGLLAPLAVGGSVVLMKEFNIADFWTYADLFKPTWYTAVPSIHQMLLHGGRPRSLPEFSFIRSCSSPLPPKVLHQLEEFFQAPVLEAYGMTEAAHQISSNPLSTAPRKPGSVGLPQGTEIHIIDEQGGQLRPGTSGEVCVRGPNLFSGYCSPEANLTAFTDDGFFRTGDTGMIDDDGYLFLTGRLKDVINKGGEKVSPAMVDNLLLQHPAIQEAICFAIPDEMYGENIGAAIVTKSGPTLDVKGLRSWVGERTVAFNVPQKVSLCITAASSWTNNSFVDILHRQYPQRCNWEDTETVSRHGNASTDLSTSISTADSCHHD
jgi:oxalate---CoA ligase